MKISAIIQSNLSLNNELTSRKRPRLFCHVVLKKKVAWHNVSILDNSICRTSCAIITFSHFRINYVINFTFMFCGYVGNVSPFTLRFEGGRPRLPGLETEVVGFSVIFFSGLLSLLI